MLNATHGFGGEAESVNDPATPESVPPVSLKATVRESVAVVVVPLVVTLVTLTAPPDRPLIVMP